MPAANPIALAERVRILGVFNNANSLAAKIGNAPPVLAANEYRGLLTAKG